MKSYQLFICLCFIAIVSEIVGEAVNEGGQYVPKAFYKIDSNGQKSRLAFIGSNRQSQLLHRLKRSAQSHVSSHSSFHSVNGGPGYFQHTIAAKPGFIVQDTNGGSGVHSTSTYVGGSPSGPGSVHQTSGVILPNGEVKYVTNTGHF